MYFLALLVNKQDFLVVDAIFAVVNAHYLSLQVLVINVLYIYAVMALIKVSRCCQVLIANPFLIASEDVVRLTLILYSVRKAFILYVIWHELKLVVMADLVGRIA